MKPFQARNNERNKVEDRDIEDDRVFEALAKCSSGGAVRSEGVGRRDKRVELLRPKPRSAVKTELRDVGWHGRLKPFTETETGVERVRLQHERVRSTVTQRMSGL